MKRKNKIRLYLWWCMFLECSIIPSARPTHGILLLMFFLFAFMIMHLFVLSILYNDTLSIMMPLILLIPLYIYLYIKIDKFLKNKYKFYHKRVVALKFLLTGSKVVKKNEERIEVFIIALFYILAFCFVCYIFYHISH